MWSRMGYFFLNKYPTQFVLNYKLCLKPSNCHVMCQAWYAVFLISNTHRRWCGPFFQIKSFFKTFHWNTNMVSWIELSCWILVRLPSFSFLDIRCKMTKTWGSETYEYQGNILMPQRIYFFVYLWRFKVYFFKTFSDWLNLVW